MRAHAGRSILLRMMDRFATNDEAGSMMTIYPGLVVLVREIDASKRGNVICSCCGEEIPKELAP